MERTQQEPPPLGGEEPAILPATPSAPRVGSDAAIWSVGDTIWGVLAAVLSLMIALTVAGLVGRPLFSLAFSGVIELSLLAVAWGFSVKRYRLKWEALGFRAPTRTGALLLLGAVLLSLAITAVYTAVIRALGFEDALPPSPFGNNQGTAVMAVTASLAILAAPFCEETFFRGFVFGGLKGRIGFWGAALTSGGLFAIAHAAPVTFIPIFGIGLVLAFVYATTRSLWYSVLVHLSYNSLVVYLSWHS